MHGMFIDGRLRELRSFGSWAKGELECASGSFQVIGEELQGLQIGGAYRMQGHPVRHPRFGDQFQVERAEPMAVDRADLEARLQRLFSGCGEKTARAITATFDAANGGIQALERALSQYPWELESHPIFHSRKVSYVGEIRMSPRERLARSISARMPNGSSASESIARVCDWLIQKHPHVVREGTGALMAALAADPYIPVLHVEGFTLQDAELLASVFGDGVRPEARVAAHIYRAVHDLCNRFGHSSVPIDQALSVIPATDDAVMRKGAAEAIERGYPLVAHEGRLYLKHIFEAETAVADGIAAMLAQGEPLWEGTLAELDARIARTESDIGIPIDEDQRAAIRGLMTSAARIHTLTANPGCGKTTVMEMVAALMSSVHFAAPTGIAAKVLTGRVRKYGKRAVTIHDLLESNGEGFARNAMHPLTVNLVVVDEAGMPDLETTAALVLALPRDAHLFLVGDVEQLESVGIGAVLRDLVSMVEPDHHKLTISHRSEAGILDLLQSIREGKFPKVLQNRPEIQFDVVDVPDDLDFAHVEQAWLRARERFGNNRVALVLGHRRDRTSHAQPNVERANVWLQDLVNPRTSRNTIPGLSMRIGDRIIVRKPIRPPRMHRGQRPAEDQRLVNGDTGILIGVHQEAQADTRAIVLQMDDGRKMTVSWAHLHKLDLGYAQTVHSTQGTEHDALIFCCGGPGSDFLNRRLLLTACSRPKRLLHLIGRRDHFESVAAHDGVARQSSLPDRIQNSPYYR